MGVLSLLMMTLIFHSFCSINLNIACNQFNDIIKRNQIGLKSFQLVMAYILLILLINQLGDVMQEFSKMKAILNVN